MQNLVAEVINPSGHTVNIDVRGGLSVVVKSAFDASAPQRFPVRDTAQFELLRDQLRRALPFCSGLIVTLRDLSGQPKATPTAPTTDFTPVTAQNKRTASKGGKPKAQTPTTQE